MQNRISKKLILVFGVTLKQMNMNEKMHEIFTECIYIYIILLYYIQVFSIINKIVKGD